MDVDVDVADVAEWMPGGAALVSALLVDVDVAVDVADDD